MTTKRVVPFPVRRPRRNRKSETVRGLIRETSLSVDNLIFPMFLTEGKKTRTDIASMPGIQRLSQDELLKEIEICLNLGLRSFCLFPNINEKKKNARASESLNPKGLYLATLKKIKTQFPDVFLMTDVAMDPYSSSGHDGVFRDGEILNDETLPILAAMAVAQAEAGADLIGPSDMMDGRVKAIRQALDAAGATHVSILSYTAKYASAFYGPFRQALDSAPRAGDKKTYQMDPGNRREASLEAELDIAEGADMLMVKPALTYMDIIADLKRQFPLPIAAYNVSGEYAMIKAAAKNGWLDGAKARDEVLLYLRRAGADIILTYFAKEYASARKGKR